MQGKCSQDAQLLMDFKLDSHVPDNQGKPGTETLVSLGKCMSTLVNLCGDITEIFFHTITTKHMVQCPLCGMNLIISPKQNCKTTRQALKSLLEHHQQELYHGQELWYPYFLSEQQQSLLS